LKEYQPQLKGWLLGTIDGQTSGIMPANYIKILGKKKVEQQQSEQESQLIDDEQSKQNKEKELLNNLKNEF
jgi:peroxin-13